MIKLRRLTKLTTPFFQLFPLIKCEGPCGIEDFQKLLVKGLNILWAFAGTAAVLVVFWGAYQFLSSAGDPAKAESARKTLWAGLIGAIIVAVAYAFTVVFARMIAGGDIEMPGGLRPGP